MKKLIILSICLGLTVLTSCGDDDGPEITISSPGDGDTFMTTDSLLLSFTVTDDVDVASISVSAGFLNTSNISGLEGTADTNVPVNGDPISLDGVLPADYTITIAATDNEGNASSESVDITVQ